MTRSAQSAPEFVGTPPFGRSDLEPLGGRCFRYEDLVVEAAGAWWVLRAPVAAGTAAAGEGWLERRGPWKLADADGALQVCDVPARALGLDRQLSSPAAASALFDWFAATRLGRAAAMDLPADCGPAPHELTARVGPFTCQGEFQRRSVGGHGTFVDFRVAAAAGEISACRAGWLDAMRAHARGLRMARVELAGDPPQLHARFDLTGCPEPYFGVLLRSAVACLRSATEWLLPAASLLTDPSVNSRALERGALINSSKEK